MSIYVEVGVDFPKGCTNCPLCNSEAVCVVTDKDLFDSCGKVLLRDGWRPDWCPLFEMDLVYCKDHF